MKKWLRRSAYVVGTLVALLVLTIGGIYGMSASVLGARPEAAAHAIDPAAANPTEGARLALIFGCTDCHGTDFGGTMVIDEKPMARLAAPNLTAGRDGDALTDEAFERAVRHGVGADGRSLIIMPSAEYTYLSDTDIANILAYIRTMPPVQRELPARSFGPVGRMLIATHKVQTQPALIASDSNARHLTRPAPDDTVQLGYYMTRICTGCHGHDLAGALPMDPSAPPGANLTPGGNPGHWSLEEFRTVFRTGRTPEGKQLNPAQMPWAMFGQANPEEIDAIWAYLQTLPAKETAATK
ncbi:MAG TPA: cytochrome c [Longimicrobiales bacterium]